MKRYIQVILPLKLAFEPWYETTRALSPGDRVPVPLSGNTYTAVVCAVSDTLPPGMEGKKMKAAGEAAAPVPPVTREELRLWRFIADYYMCSLGEVYRAAYPEEKTRGEAAEASRIKREAAAREKELEHRKTVLRNLRARLQKKEAAIEGKHSDAVLGRLESEKEKITEEIRLAERRLEELSEDQSAAPAPKPLSRTRDKAARDVLGMTGGGKPVVLQGGQETERIVTELVKDCLARGKNALVLVPETRIPEPFLKRLRRVTGGRLLPYSSSSSMGERRDVASELRGGRQAVAVAGTRSALFLPFRDLGLVAVMDEQSPAYKQDSTPRLNARDTAAVLASIHGATLLLTASLPSLETLYNIRTGRYALHDCGDTNRDITVIDVLAEARKRGMAGSLSLILIRAVCEAASKGERSLIIHPWGPVDPVVSEFATILPEQTRNGLVTVSTISDVKEKDLSGYAVMGLLEADRLHSAKDFRADEKTAQAVFSLRSRFGGRLLVQTRLPDLRALHPDRSYIDGLLKEREVFGYPPYARAVEISCHDRNTGRRGYLFGLLKGLLSKYKPEGPYPKVQSSEPEDEIPAIRISLPKDGTAQAGKREILNTVREFELSRRYSGHLTIDADPL